MSSFLDMDVVRRCTLRWPVAADLDLLATEPNAMRRCLIVAKVVDAVQDDPVLGDLASDTIETLRSEAKRRHSGETPSAPALTTALPAQRPKERTRA